MRSDAIVLKKTRRRSAAWASVLILWALTCRSEVEVVAATNPPAVDAMTATRLLDTYTAVQNKIQRLGICVKYGFQQNEDVQLAPPRSNHNGYPVKYASGEVYWDGRRCCCRLRQWGDIFVTDNVIPKEDGPHATYWFDGTRVISYSWNRRKSPLGTGFITTKRNPGGELAPNEKLITASFDAPLFGYLDRERVDTILLQATTMALSRERDSQGQPGCYVLRAGTKKGRYAVWLDPTRDYQIVRAEIHREAGDEFVGTQPLPSGCSSDYVINITQFKKVEGLWLPMEAVWTIHLKEPAGHYAKSTNHLKRTEVTLSPDFEALRAFEPDEIRDGANFVKDGVSGYVWQKGEAVPGQAPSTRKNRRGQR